MEGRFPGADCRPPSMRQSAWTSGKRDDKPAASYGSAKPGRSKFALTRFPPSIGWQARKSGKPLQKVFATSTSFTSVQKPIP